MDSGVPPTTTEPQKKIDAQKQSQNVPKAKKVPIHIMVDDFENKLDKMRLKNNQPTLLEARNVQVKQVLSILENISTSADSASRSKHCNAEFDQIIETENGMKKIIRDLKLH